MKILELDLDSVKLSSVGKGGHFETDENVEVDFS